MPVFITYYVYTVITKGI